MIDETVGNDSRKLFLDKMIDTDLKITVDRQINVISGRRLSLRDNLHDVSHVVDDEVSASLFSLKFRLHRSLNAGSSDDIARLVIRILLLKLVKLILLHLSGVSDDRRKVNAVVVTADRRLLDSDSLKLILMLHDVRDGLVIDVCRDRTRLIALVEHKSHRIADVDDLKFLPVIQDKWIAILILHLIELVGFCLSLNCFPRCDRRRILAGGIRQIVD